jgi:hypothetical protein
MSFGRCPKRLLRDVFLNIKVCLAEDNLDVLNEQSVRFEFPLEHLNAVPILFQTNFTLATWIIIITVLLILECNALRRKQNRRKPTSPKAHENSS